MVAQYLHALVYDLKLKKWGHLRIIFLTSGHCYPEIKNIFVKTKIFSKISQDIAVGPRYCRFMQKSRVQKSHATVPLKGQSHEIFCTRFFPPNSSSWSHQRCPWAVLFFFAFSQSYCTFKTTPRYFGNRGVVTFFTLILTQVYIGQF